MVVGSKLPYSMKTVLHSKAQSGIQSTQQPQCNKCVPRTDKRSRSSRRLSAVKSFCVNENPNLHRKVSAIISHACLSLFLNSSISYLITKFTVENSAFCIPIIMPCLLKFRGACSLPKFLLEALLETSLGFSCFAYGRKFFTCKKHTT